MAIALGVKGFEQGEHAAEGWAEFKIKVLRRVKILAAVSWRPAAPKCR